MQPFAYFVASTLLIEKLCLLAESLINIKFFYFCCFKIFGKYA